MSLAIPFFVFGFITFIVLIGWLLTRPEVTAADRLKELGASNTTRADEPPPVMKLAERVAEPVNRLLPPSIDEMRTLQRKLVYAGYRSPQAPLIYRSIQLGCLIGLPLFTVMVLLALGRPLSGSISWLLFAALAGYLIPRTTLDRLIANRQQRLRWGLADALDLMVVSIEAGLGINAAITRVAEELKAVHPDISEEFELLNMEIRVGRERAQALRNLAERAGVDDLRNLCAMLIQADRFGTSIGGAIRVYSDSLRTKRRQRAEQAAEKAAVKLLFPLACFLFPTLFIAILGPAALQLIDHFLKR